MNRNGIAAERASDSESVLGNSSGDDACMTGPRHAATIEGTANAGTPNKGATNAGAAKGGAPALNANRQRSGVFADPALQAVRFELGGLAPSMRRIERQARKFRATLEAATLAAHGKISVLHALCIQTAARHERHGLLCLRWLRESCETLTAGERLSFSKATADASTARDKAIERLKLDADPEADIDRFYADLRSGAIDAEADAANASGGETGGREANQEVSK